MSRPGALKTRLWVVGSAAFLIASCNGAPPTEDLPQAAVTEDWAQLPDGASWGQVTAVDTDSHGHVFVLQRAGRAWEEPFPTEPIGEPVVYMFARNGKLLDTWGAGETVMPHGLSIDGQDKVWITDAQRQQVVRFSHDGVREMTLGERGVAGDDQDHFGRPSDIAFDEDTVFVADGYANSRVIAFDRQGHFRTQWGHEGSGAGGLAIPHGIAVADGKVYVADRENGRIKIFSTAGRLLETLDTPGRPYAVKPIGAGWFVSLEGRDAAGRSGAILRVWRPDGTVERALDIGGSGPVEGHDLAVGADGTAYIADPQGGRLLVLELAQNRKEAN